VGGWNECTIYVQDYKCFFKKEILQLTFTDYEMLNSLKALDVLQTCFLSNTVPDKGVTYDFI
jgi:hypothetical protein